MASFAYHLHSACLALVSRLQPDCVLVFNFPPGTGWYLPLCLNNLHFLFIFYLVFDATGPAVISSFHARLLPPPSSPLWMALGGGNPPKESSVKPTVSAASHPFGHQSSVTTVWSWTFPENRFNLCKEVPSPPHEATIRRWLSHLEINSLAFSAYTSLECGICQCQGRSIRVIGPIEWGEGGGLCSRVAK